MHADLGNQTHSRHTDGRLNAKRLRSPAGSRKGTAARTDMRAVQREGFGYAARGPPACLRLGCLQVHLVCVDEQHCCGGVQHEPSPVPEKVVGGTAGGRSDMGLSTFRNHLSGVQNIDKGSPARLTPRTGRMVENKQVFGGAQRK